MKEYSVHLEIAGPAAMFTRPDTGAAPVSYPVPTYSAAKGMFEAVARLKSAYIRPTKVEICAPIRYEKYLTDYGGPLRKGEQISKCASYQLAATILVDVCYRLYGQVEAASDPPKKVNHLHALQDMFTRRLEKGQFFYPPCLGWKEFVPRYCGPFRSDTKRQEDVSIVLPSLLHSVFDRPVNGEKKPEFRHNVVIRKGVLEYAE